MARRFKRKSTFSFKSLRGTNKFANLLKLPAKTIKSSPRLDEDEGEGYTVMAETWPSKAENRLAEPYTRPDGVKVEVKVSAGKSSSAILAV